VTDRLDQLRREDEALLAQHGREKEEEKFKAAEKERGERPDEEARLVEALAGENPEESLGERGDRLQQEDDLQQREEADEEQQTTAAEEFAHHLAAVYGQLNAAAGVLRALGSDAGADPGALSEKLVAFQLDQLQPLFDELATIDATAPLGDDPQGQQGQLDDLREHAQRLGDAFAKQLDRAREADEHWATVNEALNNLVDQFRTVQACYDQAELTLAGEQVAQNLEIEKL
jgi:hypothetical protein